MAENTKIEWATHTFNPWTGCTKVSPACNHCYAESWAKRSGTVAWGAGAERRRTTPANWRQPVKWNRQAQIQHDAWERFKETNPGLTDEQLIAQGFTKPMRPRVFCASLADVFDNAVPVQWRMDLFSLIADTPYLDWLLVTKRIGNVMKMCSGDGLMFDMIGSCVWLGITVCNEEEAVRDIPKLLQVPAAKRFLSIEPLLGAVSVFSDMTGELLHTSGNEYDPGSIDWVIVGGESGAHARPMHPQWVLDLRDQCKAAFVPFFFKQWGEWFPNQLRAGGDLGGDMRRGIVQHVCADRENDGHFRRGDVHMRRVGKKTAGRVLNGRVWDEVPQAPIEINIEVGEKP